MNRPTCEELGFCQALAECPLDMSLCQTMAECHVACSGPPQPQRYPFAPGVIDPGEPESRVEALSRGLVLLALLGAVAAVAGFASGYLDVGALLP